MSVEIDQYAHLKSPIHQWEPRRKFIGLMALIMAFALVEDLRLIPIMLGITLALYLSSRLPLSFWVRRVKYPGFFLLAIVALLPWSSGKTVIWQWGILTLRQEGALATLLIVSRFLSIVTIGLVLFGTMPFLTTVKAMRSLGISPVLADMLLLSYRYLFEIAENLMQMQRAMRLRGFQSQWRMVCPKPQWYLPDWQALHRVALLVGTLLVRSYEQSEQIYRAMQLRGYGHQPLNRSQYQPSSNFVLMQNQPFQVQSEDAIAISKLCFSYPNRPDVLRDVSLRVKRGDRLGIIGYNGCGKTTLFLLICGVLTPVVGKIVVFSELVKPGNFRPDVGLVFQNPDDQLFSASVWDDVAFAPQNMGLSANEVESRVQTGLALTGTAELIHRPPHHLSGGEKRMVAIAGVLAMQPSIVIYDEPTANLDLRARRRLIRFLQQSQQTLLISSHDLEFILEVCDRVILLSDGQIVADGNPSQIMSNVLLMEAHGLEVPHSLVSST